MTDREWALLFHLVGLVLLFSGLTLAAAALAAARRRIFGRDSNENGLRRDAITDPEEIRQLTAYFAWSAWAASTERPGHNYTYTNNWPPEPLVDNKPGASSAGTAASRRRSPSASRATSR